MLFTKYFLLLPLAPQPLVRPWPPPQSSSIYPSPTPTHLVAAGSSIQPNFWRLLNIFFFFRFYRVGLLAPRPTPTLEAQVSVFISSRCRVAQLYPQAPGTHFSRFLRHAWVTVGLFLFPGHHTGTQSIIKAIKFRRI
jgi:hypothetical protein